MVGNEYGSEPSWSGDIRPCRGGAGADGYALFGVPGEQWEVWLDWDPFLRAVGLRLTPVDLSSGDGTPGLMEAP